MFRDLIACLLLVIFSISLFTGCPANKPVSSNGSGDEPAQTGDSDSGDSASGDKEETPTPDSDTSTDEPNKAAEQVADSKALQSEMQRQFVPISVADGLKIDAPEGAIASPQGSGHRIAFGDHFDLLINPVGADDSIEARKAATEGDNERTLTEVVEESAEMLIVQRRGEEGPEYIFALLKSINDAELVVSNESQSSLPKSESHVRWLVKSAMTLRGDDANAEMAVVEPEENACLLTLNGHSDRIRGAQFSPDGEKIVSGAQDGTVRLWDAATGDELHTMQGHTNWVWCVAFSPDGKQVASGSGDSTIKVWDVAGGEEALTLKGHDATSPVYGVAFSPDGKRLASCSGDQTIKLWDLKTGNEIRSFPGHRNDIWRVDFSHDGTRLASCSSDRSVKLWNVATGKEIKTLSGHYLRVYGLDFGEKYLVSAAQDRSVRQWDAETGDRIRTLKGHDKWLTCVALSPDEDRIASGGEDMTIKLWDASSGDELRTLRGHDANVASLDFSADGTRLVSGSWDTTLKIWNVEPTADE